MNGVLPCFQTTKRDLIPHALLVVWRLLLSCTLAPALVLVPAQSATLSIPGAVRVIIQPPEAVSDGARWSVNGAPLQSSGAVLTNLAPGTYQVSFNNLPAWLEPELEATQVIGGTQTDVTATYRRLPRFYFRAVPAQRASAGATLEFLVHTDDPGDPQNPGAGASLVVTASPAPAGSIALDNASGRFTYSPAAADRLPFVVTLRTAQGVQGTFEVTPLNARPAEDIVIDVAPRPVDPSLPLDESRDFIQITETRNPPDFVQVVTGGQTNTIIRTFNNHTNDTINVTISGKTLVFGQGHPNHLQETYSEDSSTPNPNIREFQLYADKIIIRSPLLLPQALVSIHARELRFEGNGRIETTPKPREGRPAGADFFLDNLSVGRDGNPGYDAGNVDVFVERFFSDGTTSTRFVMLGGNGGRPGEGRNGMNEAALAFGSANWTKLMSRAGNRVCETDGPKVVIFRQRMNEEGDVTSTCGTQVSARGEKAVRSGVPGTGGRGGILRSTLNLSAHAQVGGGAAGTKGLDYVGGTLDPNRPYVWRFITSIFINGKVEVSTRDQAAPKVLGANATAPNGTNGVTGSLVVETNSAAWLHSFIVRHVVQFAKDAYLNGRVSEARQLLAEYQAVLRAFSPSDTPVDELSDAAFSERVNLDQLLTEHDVLVHRIDSNLDYFGNPAGWVPMLSFEANFLAFQREIDASIPILYLSYWLNNTATNLQAKMAAATNALATLAAENVQLLENFEKAQLSIPQLKDEAEAITVQIDNLRKKLALQLTELERRANENVAERHKLPFWKKAIGVLSVVADLVPVGQPAVGRIGEGLKLLGQVDPDHPLESAEKLVPQAFGVMTNKNITVCFGTNAPANTNTNSTSSTNSVKKAKQDKLKQATDCSKFLGAELKELAGVFKDAQVDDKELAAELEKLKASDPVFQQLVAELETLNAQKTDFVQRLTAALQIIATLDDELAENAVAALELEEKLKTGFAALDHGALLHIKAMESRALNRLLEYQYFLAKSFNYRQLEPYPGNLQLTNLFNRFKVLLDTGHDHVLSEPEFANLKALFTDELREIVFRTLDNFNAAEPTETQTLSLTPDQLARLNRDGRVVINLFDLNPLTLTRENIRIADLKTKRMSVQPVGGSFGQRAMVGVNFEHSGVSHLTAAGQQYLFRHYTARTVNPIVWHSIFNALDSAPPTNSELSPEQQSLLRVLLAGENDLPEKLLFFSEPALNADVVITRELSTDNGVDLAITDLQIEVRLHFDNTSSTQRRKLEVVVADNLTPIITVDPPDLNGRQDGQGSFTRFFSQGRTVTLQAPATFGEFQFEGWVINDIPATTASTFATFTLNSDVRAKPLFHRPPQGFALTSLSAASGQIGFNFGTELGKVYTIERAFSLTSPVWAPVETRPGNGSPIQFTRPVGASPSVFFRVRVD
jgi:hypothetical protein